MRSTHPEDQRGPRPAWNGIGFGLVAVAVALFVVFSPAQRVDEDPSPTAPTISLDDLRAMLTDAPGEPPVTIQVETPDGPVRVVVPTTTEPTPTPRPRPTTTTTTTSTAPPTTTVPPRDPNAVMQDFLEDLGAVPTTTEVVDE